MTPAKRTLTLGITVNLDNYENLRLEVSGEVASDQDADELAAFLDAALSRLGRGDAATAERVDTYRRRVFSKKAAEKHAEPAVQKVLTPTAAEPETAGTAKPLQTATKDLPEPVHAAAKAEPLTTPAPADAVKRPEPSVTTPGPATPVPPAPQPAAKSAPAQGQPAADLCEECKAAVTKTQKQMSQLFLNRTLCKACMDRLTHAR